MDGSCDYCGKPFEEGDDVVNVSYSTWDEADGRMRADFSRDDYIVHTKDCLRAFAD